LQLLRGDLRSIPSTVPVKGTVPPNEKGALKPLDYLLPQHELVQALGISAETASAWESGFASVGRSVGSGNGVDNVVSFFTDITPQNLETLAALCDQKRYDAIGLF
jgi:hypothetical protein